MRLEARPACGSSAKAFPPRLLGMGSPPEGRRDGSGCSPRALREVGGCPSLAVPASSIMCFKTSSSGTNFTSKGPLPLPAGWLMAGTLRHSPVSHVGPAARGRCRKVRKEASGSNRRNLSPGHRAALRNARGQASGICPLPTPPPVRRGLPAAAAAGSGTQLTCHTTTGLQRPPGGRAPSVTGTL